LTVNQIEDHFDYRNKKPEEYRKDDEHERVSKLLIGKIVVLHFSFLLRNSVKFTFKGVRPKDKRENLDAKEIEQREPGYQRHSHGQKIDGNEKGAQQSPIRCRVEIEDVVR
jgi:hypothetical protein